MNARTLVRRAAVCVALVAALAQARAGEAQPAPSRLLLGTAFVVHPDGYLLTCYHVIKNRTADKAGKLQVMFSEGDKAVFHDATVVATNAKHDLALLRVQASGLPAIPLGDSDKVKLQEEVLAGGFPVGVTRTFNAVDGKVTSVHYLAKHDLKLLQSNAAVNPGHSGGPLLNARGEAIGVISFRQEFYTMVSPDGKVTPRILQNVSLAVAINHARPLLRGVGQAAISQPLSEAPKEAMKGDVLAERVRPAIAWVCALSEGGSGTPPPPPPTEPTPRPEVVKLEPVRVWSDHPGPVRVVAFSPKGDLVASGGDGQDHRVLLREVQTGAVRPPFIAPKGFFDSTATCALFFPKGDLILTAGTHTAFGCTAYLWDPYTGRRVGQIGTKTDGYLTRAALSPDGGSLLTWSRLHNMVVWDVQRRAKRLTLGQRTGNSNDIKGAAFLPGGEIIISLHKKEYRLWHAQTGAQPTTVEMSDHATGFALSPDGKCMLVSHNSPDAVELVEINSGTIAWREPGGHLNRMGEVWWQTFSPGGGLVAVACNDRDGGNVLILDSKDGTLLGAAGLKKRVNAVAFSPDGKLLATGDEGGNVGVWSMGTLSPK